MQRLAHGGLLRTYEQLCCAEVPGDVVSPTFPFIELHNHYYAPGYKVHLLHSIFLSSRGQELGPTLAFCLISYTLNTTIEKEFSAIEKQRRPERLDPG